MSNYIQKAINPETGELEDAEFLDDYYAHRRYGIRFADGRVYPEDEIKTESP